MKVQGKYCWSEKYTQTSAAAKRKGKELTKYAAIQIFLQV